MEIGNRVDHNKESVVELEKSIVRMNKEKAELAVYPLPKIQTEGEGLSIKDVMMGQARFSTAIQLDNSPTMLFGGELNKYVQFITMFRNSFDKYY